MNFGHRGATNKFEELPITFGSHDIKLKGKVLLPDNSSIESPAPGAVLCHGFGASQKAMQSSAKIMASQGVAVLIFDFRGHGSSEGTMDGQMADDVVDAWNTLRGFPEVDNERMSLVGHSLGAMSVIMAAEKVDNLRVLVTLSCPPPINLETFPDIPSNFGHWGRKNGDIMEYPRQGSFPWLKGIAGLLSRVWMYVFGYRVRIDLKRFFEETMQMNMADVVQKLEDCFKLFVFCEGDNVTPYHKSKLIYAIACEPKIQILAKGGFHTTPLMRGKLRSQWTSWAVTTSS